MFEGVTIGEIIVVAVILLLFVGLVRLIPKEDLGPDPDYEWPKQRRE